MLNFLLLAVIIIVMTVKRISKRKRLNFLNAPGNLVTRTIMLPFVRLKLRTRVLIDVYFLSASYSGIKVLR